MEYINIYSYREKILISFDQDMLEGIDENWNFEKFVEFVKSDLQDVVKYRDGKIYVPKEIVNDDYINEYFQKKDTDWNTLDCVYLALRHVGIPPIEEMSIDSLKKTVEEVFREYSNKVYIKRKGKNNTYCVDYQTAQEIVMHQALSDKIKKQIKKAEKNHTDNVDWRAYEFEKEKIAILESLNNSEDNCEAPMVLSSDEKNRLMLEAIYKMMFSIFDFDKYENYLDEMNLLYDNWEFGERYQELYDIFHSPNYKGEFYKINPDDEFVDFIAEKISEKIIEKIKKI